MVTYLVVLLQFQISIPDDSQNNVYDEEFVNVTAASTEAVTTPTTILTTVLTTLARKKKKKN